MLEDLVPQNMQVYWAFSSPSYTAWYLPELFFEQVEDVKLEMLDDLDPQHLQK